MGRGASLGRGAKGYLPPQKRTLRVKRTYKKVAKPVNSFMTKEIGTQVQTTNRSLVPPKKLFKLRYTQTFQFTTGAAGVFGTAQQMRLNSLFDPDYTGGGHQPYLFDSFSPLYANYLVKKAKVKLLWSTIGGTADICCAAQVNVNSTGQVLAGQTADQVTERQSASTCILSASGNTRTREQHLNVNIAKIFGKPDAAIVIEDSYGALVTTNPSQVCYLSVAIASYSGVAAEGATCQMIIDYEGEFHNAIDQTQS